LIDPQDNFVLAAALDVRRRNLAFIVKNFDAVARFQAQDIAEVMGLALRQEDLPGVKMRHINPP
jgi:hypothetical protein